MKIIKRDEGAVLELEEKVLKDLRNGKSYKMDLNKLLDNDGNIVYQIVRFSMLDANGNLVMSKANTTSYLAPEKGVLAEDSGNSLINCYDGNIYDLDGFWYGGSLMFALGLLFL